MIRKYAGNATVAFVFTVPLVLLLFLTVVDVGLLGVEKMRLNHLAFELARETAISSLPPEQWSAYVKARLNRLGSDVESHLRWRTLPGHGEPVLLLELMLIRRRAYVFPWLHRSSELTAVAWEPRC